MRNEPLFWDLAMGLAAFSSFFLPVSPASAPIINYEHPQEFAQLYNNCPNARNNIELKQCIRGRYEASDRQLNNVYEQLVFSVNSEEKKLLIQAQRSWIQLRDNNCEFEAYLPLGGTVHRAVFTNCLDRITRQRVVELESYLRQEQG